MTNSTMSGRYLYLLIAVGVSLLLLISIVSACQVIAQQTAEPYAPPRLLDVVPIAGPKDIAVALNGWTYVVSDGGARGWKIANGEW
ncbi:MAG: hypothetical protein R2911_20830 [Caldilineaceae bacterium]